MNELKDLLTNQIYNIDNIEYITASYIIRNYGLTARRLKLWREGRGQAKNEPLNYKKINKGTFLYSKVDIEKLILLTNDYNHDKPTTTKKTK